MDSRIDAPSRRVGAAAACAALLAAGLLGGCAVYAPPPPPVYDAYGAPVVVGPPVVGVAPYPGAIWIEGGWVWRGGHREWAPGRWDRGYGRGGGWRR